MNDSDVTRIMKTEVHLSTEVCIYYCFRALALHWVSHHIIFIMYIVPSADSDVNYLKSIYDLDSSVDHRRNCEFDPRHGVLCIAEEGLK